MARGFSMIELLVVVAIILTIAAIAIPNLVSAIYIAKVARAVADISNIEESIGLYQSINSVLPDDLSQVGYGSLLDPWGNPLRVFESRHDAWQRPCPERPLPGPSELGL